MGSNKDKKTEAATGGVLYEKVFLEISQNSQENTWARVSFFQACNFNKKETLAQAFSCEQFFTEHFWATATEKLKNDAICIR